MKTTERSEGKGVQKQQRKITKISTFTSVRKRRETGRKKGGERDDGIQKRKEAVKKKE